MLALLFKLLRKILPSTCPDCNGHGNTIGDSGCNCLAVHYTPCRLCRGKGKITD